MIKVEVGVWLRLITLTETLIDCSGYHENRIELLFYYTSNEFFPSRFTLNACFQSSCQLFLFFKFSQFFLFHVISKQLLCHLRRPFCVLWVLVFNYFFRWLDLLTKQTWKSCFWFFTDGQQHKARELDMITLRNHAQRSYITWLLVTLSVVDMIFV